jgi:hypothetical protein
MADINLRIPANPGPDVLVKFVEAAIPGSPGSAVLGGNRAPTTEDGKDGDWWINTAGRLIYGPKAGGGWPSGISIAIQEIENSDTGQFHPIRLRGTYPAVTIEILPAT